MKKIKGKIRYSLEGCLKIIRGQECGIKTGAQSWLYQILLCMSFSFVLDSCMYILLVTDDLNSTLGTHM